MTINEANSLYLEIEVEKRIGGYLIFANKTKNDYQYCILSDLLEMYPMNRNLDCYCGDGDIYTTEESE